MRAYFQHSMHVLAYKWLCRVKCVYLGPAAFDLQRPEILDWENAFIRSWMSQEIN